jgi:hypothetical protein
MDRSDPLRSPSQNPNFVCDHDPRTENTSASTNISRTSRCRSSRSTSSNRLSSNGPRHRVSRSKPSPTAAPLKSPPHRPSNRAKQTSQVPRDGTPPNSGSTGSSLSPSCLQCSIVPMTCQEVSSHVLYCADC